MPEHPADGQSPDQFIRDNAWIFVPSIHLKPEGRAARRRAAERFEARWEGKPAKAQRCTAIIDARSKSVVPRIPALLVTTGDGDILCLDNTMGMAEMKVFIAGGLAEFAHRQIRPLHILNSEDPEIDLDGMKEIFDQIETGALPTIVFPGLVSAFLPKAPAE